MNCTACGKEANVQAKFCSECGNDLKIQNNINIESGDNSVNFGQQNQVTGNTININSNEDASNKAYIDRTKVRPLSVAGTQLKASWLLVSGLLSFFGSIASILGFIGTEYQFIFIITMAIGAILFPIGMALVQSKHLDFPPFFNLETGSKGEIYITKVEGSCPKCTGKLKLRSIGPKNNKTTVVRCTRNPDHMWGFDPTVLPDL
ncbi:zinc ribbon domain-containing protein [Pseudoalteromonas sp. SG43-1]|nr:zinc ribbon domain-containing protein [Pseudoalteromonas sp. SG43-1]